MSTVHAHPAVHALVTQEQDVGPPSPTLTNPDMILPYTRLNASPAPSSANSMHQRDSSVDSISNAFYMHPGGSQAELGVAQAVSMPYRLKSATVTPMPIIPMYTTTYEHGAPLSDIGEEESTPKSKTTRSDRSSPRTSLSPTPSSTPTLRHKKRLSDRSDSSTGSEWEDFDVTKMPARLAADVANADDDMTDLGLKSKRNSMVSNGDDDMNTLNQKAELILANAKKRLTHMEGNLSKARTSIISSPRSSPVLGEHHQPAGGLYHSISQGADRKLGLGTHLKKSKPLYPVIKSVATGHTRVSSETSVPSNSTRLSRIPEIRSASALEYGHQYDLNSPKASSSNYSPLSNRSFNSPLTAWQEEAESPSTTKTSPENITGLGISESRPTGDVDRAMTTGSPSLQRSSSQTSTRSTRSTRELREQMSDLKVRIADLKSKAQVDKLKRSSSGRTPSPYGQSPEQFYATAPEYNSPGTPIHNNAGFGWSPTRIPGPFAGALQSPKDSAFGEGEVATPAAATHQTDARTDVNTPNLHKRTPTQIALPRGDEETDFHSIRSEGAPEANDETEEDPIAATEEEQIFLNEALEESLQDAEPEVPPIPDDSLGANGQFERHEDRLDAFDYENMFLHSALGNYGQDSPRSRSNSDSSVETKRAIAQTPPAGDDEFGDDSEEQLDEDDEEIIIIQNLEERARGKMPPVLEEHEPLTPRPLEPPSAPWMRPARSNSLDSVSSTATFATAMEGDYTDEEEEGKDSVPEEILNWGNGPISAANPTTTTRSAWPTPPTGMSRSASRSKPLVPAAAASTQPRILSRQAQSQSQPPAPTLPPPPPPVAAPIPSQQQGQQVQQQQQPQHHPANTEILMASLITLADPTFRTPQTPGTFADVDKELVIALLRAVGSTCNAILKCERRGEVYESKLCRRRLDAARVVLEGGAGSADALG